MVQGKPKGEGMRTAKILIVEDEPNMVQACAIILSMRASEY